MIKKPCHYRPWCCSTENIKYAISTGTVFTKMYSMSKCASNTWAKTFCRYYALYHSRSLRIHRLNVDMILVKVTYLWCSVETSFFTSAFNDSSLSLVRSCFISPVENNFLFVNNVSTQTVWAYPTTSHKSSLNRQGFIANSLSEAHDFYIFQSKRRDSAKTFDSVDFCKMLASLST